MSIKALKNMLRPIRNLLRSPEPDVVAYLQNGRRPWSRGYTQFKEKFICERLTDLVFLDKLCNGVQLPANYGEFLDERVVEYPWFMSRVNRTPGRLLDAGSTLNYPFAVRHPWMLDKEISIVTLAPEANCFWQDRVAYLFADIRNLPFRDNHFDEVVSISTIEHIGKDNTSLYTSDSTYCENNEADYLTAVRELKRVCKPGGKVYITVPFGKVMDFGWYQQFDMQMIDRLIDVFAPSESHEAYFKYEGGGWQFADKHLCGDLEGFDIHSTRYMNRKSNRDYDDDFAAASRGIAALELHKDAKV